MVHFELADVLLGIDGLVPSFNDSYFIARQYRKNNRLRFFGSTNKAIVELRNILPECSVIVADSYQEFYSTHGGSFANGDEESRKGLKDITALIRREVVTPLQATLEGSFLANPAHLVSVASKATEDAVSILEQLALRLVANESTKPHPLNAAYPPSVNSEGESLETPEREIAYSSRSRTAKVLTTFKKKESNEITIREGKIITDIEFPDTDWWYGTYHGQKGYFPSNHVELLE
ncbi:Endophilin-A1 [Dactylellina cionopaga]|nr:Endophilin-A1 [Dactylellina cionopaga]